jgi:hypothetical protein
MNLRALRHGQQRIFSVPPAAPDHICVVAGSAMADKMAMTATAISSMSVKVMFRHTASRSNKISRYE